MSTNDVLITPGSGEVKWVDSGGSDFVRIIGDAGATNTITFVGDDNTANGVIFQDHATDVFYPATSGLNLGVSANRWNLFATAGDFSGTITTATNITLSGASSTITINGASAAINMGGSAGLFTLSSGSSILLSGATSSITLTGLSSVLTLAGVTGTNLAPLKFTTGSAPGTSVAGQMWWTGGSNLQFAKTNGTASTFAFTDTDLSTFTVGILGVARGGTGTGTSFTTGSVVFAGGSGVYTQDNANFFWDDSNNTLGVGTTRSGAISGTNPSVRIKGTGTSSATSSFEIQDSAAASLFLIRNDGLINFGSKGTYTESTGQLALTATGGTGGLLIGGDVNIYRGAANVLATDDSLTVGGTYIEVPNGYFSAGEGGGGFDGQVKLLGSSSGTITIQPQTVAGTYNFNLPTTAGSSGDILTSGGGGATAMTWTAPGALAVRWNSIANPTGNQSLTMSTYTTTWNWATGTSTNNLFNLTTDASANGTGYLLNIATGTSSTVKPLRVNAAGSDIITVSNTGATIIATPSYSSVSALSIVIGGGNLQESSSQGYTRLNYTLATAVFTTAAAGSVGAADTGGYADVTTSYNTGVVNITNGGTLYNRFYIGYYGGVPKGLTAYMSGTGGTTGVGGALTWERWDGAAWASVTGSNLTSDGPFNISSAATSRTTINGVSAFWIRATVSTGYSTAPVSKFGFISGFSNNTNAPWMGSGLFIGKANMPNNILSTIAGNNAAVITMITSGNGEQNILSAYSEQTGSSVFLIGGDGSITASSADNTFRNLTLAGGASNQNAVLTLTNGSKSQSAWGTSGALIRSLSGTRTDSSTAISGTATNAVFHSFNTPTLAATNTSVTTTNVANVYIEAAPIQGTNQTITNSYALWVDSGTTRLDGNTLIGTLTSTRITYAGTSGLLQDSANMTFDGNRISLATAGSSGGLLIGGDVNIYRSAANTLATDDALLVAGGSVTVPGGIFSSGGAGAVLGQLVLNGNTSGSVTIQPQANAGAYNFNLPTTAGSSGEILTSAGGAGAAMTWTAPGALAVRWNSIANPTGNQSLTMGTNRTTWSWSGTQTGHMVSLTTAPSMSGVGYSLVYLENGTDASNDMMKLVVDGSTRFFVDFQGFVYVGSLTSSRITYAGASGLLQDSANMTFDGNRVSLATTGNTGGLLIGGDTNLYRVSADNLRTDDSFQALNVLVNNNQAYKSKDSGGTATDMIYMDGSDNFLFNAKTAKSYQWGINGTEYMRLNTTGLGIFTNNPSYALSLGGTAARTVAMERATSGAGNNLTVQSGGAQSVGTNLAAGTLILGSGTATGSAAGYVDIYAVNNTGVVGGTTDNPAAIHARFGSGKFGFGTSTLTYDITLASMVGAAPYTYAIGMLDSTLTSGYSLNIQAGHAITTADLPGGSVIITAGNSTGTGASSIAFQTATAGSTGTTVRTSSTKITISGTAMSLSPHGTAAGSTFELGFLELAANGTNYLSFKAPDSIGTTITHTLPSDVPAAGEALKVTSYSGGVAVLEWGSVASSLSIGSAITSSTVGSVLFVGASSDLQQDNANLFFDDTNDTLGVGTTRSGAISATNPRLRVKGSGTSASTLTFESQNSGGTTLFSVRDEGLISFGAGGTFLGTTISQAAWTTSGVRLKIGPNTITDTTSSGTVALEYTDLIGGDTIAASSSTTFTDYVGTQFKDPVAGTNVVSTSKFWSLGADTLRVRKSFGVIANNTTATAFYLEQSGSGDGGAVCGHRMFNYGLYTTGSNNLNEATAFMGNLFSQTSAGTTSTTTIVNATTRIQGAGNVTTSEGMLASLTFSSTGNVTNYWGFHQTAPTKSSTGLVTGIAAAFRAENMGALGTGTTSAYGLYIDAQSGALTNNYAIYIAGTAGTSANGISWNNDTNLYRSAADTLKTDDSLVIATNLTVNSLTTTRVPFASTSGLLIDSANFTYTTGTGQMTLATTGSGAGLLIGGDAQLYRDAADVLRTPDSIRVDVGIGLGAAAPASTAGKLQVTGSTTSDTVDYNTAYIQGTHSSTVNPTTARIWGLRFTAAQGSSGTYTNTTGATGIEGLAEFTGSTSAEGVTGAVIYARCNTASVATLVRATGIAITMGSGVAIPGATNGIITNLRPLDITWDTAFSANSQSRCGIRIGAGPTNAGSFLSSVGAGIYFNSNSRGVQDGIVWGTAGDTNLYSSASDTLKTDDSFVVGANLTVSTLTTTRVPFMSTSGLFVDSANFTYTTGTGQLALATTGSGAGILIGGDVQLYRIGANIMSMAASDSFEIPSGFLGVGTTAPTSACRVNITYNATVGSGTERSVLFTGAVSAAHTGFYNITQSEGSTTNTTGTVNWIAGALNRIRAQSTGGTVTTIYGLHNMAWMDSASGTMTYSTNTGVQCEALWSNTAFTGTATVTSNIALNASNTHVTLAGGGTVNIASEYGLNIQASVNTGIVITTRYGIRVNDPTGSTGTLTTQYGLYFEDLDRAGTNYGLYFAGTSGLSRQGIWWNADTNLYRSAADTLKTDDAFVSGSTLTGASSLTLGANSGTTGSILIRGTTSGTVTMTVAAAAGTWSFTIPTTAGSSGQYLQTDGAGVTSWQTLVGGMTWATNASSPISAVASNGYVANLGTLLTYNLPTPAVGSEIEIVGLGAGGWRAQCASTHTIRMGTTVSAATGYAASTSQYDSIRIIGVSATQWHIVSAVGTIDIV